MLMMYSPQTPQELYNLRHSSLRNAIERIFGVLKKRFPILKNQLEFSYNIQVRLVKVLCCLHNIIRLIDGDDIYDEEWEREQRLRDSECEEDDDDELEPVRSKRVTVRQYTAAQRMRDSIAEQMWMQYPQRSKKRKI
jgi:DDE superfamily endonuclease